MSENNKASGFSHEKIETSNFLMIVLIVLVVAVGVLVASWMIARAERKRLLDLAEASRG